VRSPGHWLKIREREPVLVLILLLAVWFLAALYIGDPKVFPGPGDVMRHSLPDFAVVDNLAPSPGAGLAVLGRHLAATAVRGLLGSILGTALGLLAGLWVGLRRSERVRELMTDLIATLKNLPIFAFIPLFLFWFSASNQAIVAYVAFASALLMAPAATAAALSISRDYGALADSCGIQGPARARLFLRPLLRLLRPTFRWNLALVWAFSLGAEYAGSPGSGLGMLAYQAYLWADLGRMMVLALVYLIAGIGSLWLFDTLLDIATHARRSNQPESL